jgi:putative nucleotidyltransferase with HDIG domain
MPRNPRFREICASFDEAVEFAAWEGRSIAEAVTEFFDGDAGVGEAELRRIVVGTGPLAAQRLPVLPKAASRLLRTSEADTSAAELEQLASADQVLAGRLIGAANSARYGSRFAITRLGEAVLRMGVPAARQVLLASCMAGLFASKPLQNLWEHSQMAADVASTLAGLVDIAPETAYAAGLLHDIGRLVFVSAPADRQRAELCWRTAGFPRAYAETLVYGEDHAAAGARLLRAWEVPNEIVGAVELHHRPEKTDSPLGSLLCLTEVSIGAEPEDLWTNMRRIAACRKTGISREQVSAAIEGGRVRETVCA